MTYAWGIRASTLGASVLGMMTSPALAQTGPAQIIEETSLIDVPLVLGEIQNVETTPKLWTRGNVPENTLMAQFTVQPVQVASVTPPNGPSDMVLWRAFPGGGITRMNADELDLTHAPYYFCGTREASAAAGTAMCFIDDDGNGSFDKAAVGVNEEGTRPYHITVIRPVQALPTPISYTILANNKRPSITIDLRNCDKDYDRPRYSAVALGVPNIPVRPQGYSYLSKDNTMASCIRGRQIDDIPNQQVPIPDRGYLAQMGPMAFTIGTKDNPTLTLVGPADPTAIYRLEGARLVNMRVGQTPAQAELIALKKFPHPMLMTDTGSVINQGTIASGGVVANLRFHHAYRGRLTQNISISTLFGTRSLTAGTTVYGFPAQSKLTVTRGGIPDSTAVGDDTFRKLNVDLTWCTPVKNDAPKEEKPQSYGKNGWSSSCIPFSTLGNYTIINNVQPAFFVNALAYDAQSASNDGKPPIIRDDQAVFDQPLRMEYIFVGKDNEFISLRERIYLGDELTSSRLETLYAPNGTITVEMAGAPVELAAAPGGTLTVRSSGQPVVGTHPRLKSRASGLNPAMLRWLRQRLGKDTAAPLAIETENEATAPTP